MDWMKRVIRPISLALILSLVLYLGLMWPQHYSEESLLSTHITDEVFGGMWQLKRHMILRYANESQLHTITQRERLDYTVKALNATINVLGKVGLEAFIDAGTLLGHYRHDGVPIPWDIDGDVGIFGDVCREKYPDQTKLLELLRSEIEPSYYHVEVFDCTYPPAPGTDFTGVVTDTRNGFKVDIFSYNEVDTSGDSYTWRKGQQWLLRDDERGRHFRVTPRESIIPLKYGNFSGIIGNIIPNDPELRLRWDFGMVLEGHILPYRLNMDVSMSILSFIGIVYLLVTSEDKSFIGTVVVISAVFGGGIRVCLVALSILLLNRSGSTSRILREIVTVLVLASLVYDLYPIMPQLYSHLMEAFGLIEYRLNPGRYCFLHEDIFCIDY